MRTTAGYFKNVFSDLISDVNLRSENTVLHIHVSDIKQGVSDHKIIRSFLENLLGTGNIFNQARI